MKRIMDGNIPSVSISIKLSAIHATTEKYCLFVALYRTYTTVLHVHVIDCSVCCIGYMLRVCHCGSMLLLVFYACACCIACQPGFQPSYSFFYTQIVSEGGSPTNETVWQISGTKGNRWNEAQVMITHPQNFRVGLDPILLLYISE